MYILDTDVISSLRKTKKHPRVQAWIERTGWEELGTSVITVAEIQCGTERQRQSNADYADATHAWLDRFLEIGEPHVHTLSVKAALLLARMHETPALRNFVLPDAKQKRPRTAADLAIAAIAITEGAAIATGNHEHFEMIGGCFPLPGIYNPFEDSWSARA